MRRMMAEWIGNLADRLLHFQSQLRSGFIRMLSTSVAETIEDQFHRPNHNAMYRDPYEEYYDDRRYDETPHPAPQLSAQVTPSSPPESPKQSPAGTHTRGWLGILSHATQILTRWVRAPWAEPLLATAVTLISIVLLVR